MIKGLTHVTSRHITAASQLVGCLPQGLELMSIIAIHP